MVDSYLFTKFDANSLDGFWENAFCGHTDNGRPRHSISSADTVKANQLKFLYPLRTLSNWSLVYNHNFYSCLSIVLGLFFSKKTVHFLSLPTPWTVISPWTLALAKVVEPVLKCHISINWKMKLVTFSPGLVAKWIDHRAEWHIPVCPVRTGLKPPRFETSVSGLNAHDNVPEFIAFSKRDGGWLLQMFGLHMGPNNLCYVTRHFF